MELILGQKENLEQAYEIILMAKAHLKAQGIDQWQNGYPDKERLELDFAQEKAYFLQEEGEILGYLCVDFQGEPAYDTLKGAWTSEENYVVVHRMALHENIRGKNKTGEIFPLVEALAKSKGVSYFRIDTDEDNHKMLHILEKNGFQKCGIIHFDNSEKIGFDKMIHE